MLRTKINNKPERRTLTHAQIWTEIKIMTGSQRLK